MVDDIAGDMFTFIANEIEKYSSKFGRMTPGILQKLKAIELLPYHRLGIETYRNLDRDYFLKDLALSTQKQILERAGFMARQNPGVPIRVGGGFVGQ